MKKGHRKTFGFVVSTIMLFIGAKWLLPENFTTFARYLFLSFMAFVGGNSFEYLKEVLSKVKGE